MFREDADALDESDAYAFVLYGVAYRVIIKTKSAVMRRLGVRRFIAKNAVDYWLKFYAEEGKYLKGAFESEEFARLVKRAKDRGHHSPKKRKRIRDAKAQEAVGGGQG